MHDLILQRNSDFLAATRQVIAAMKTTPGNDEMTWGEISRQAALRPAPTYYVTYEYALRVIRVLRHGRMGLRRDRRREMFEEINRKVTAVQNATGTSLPSALDYVLKNCPASQFFISPATAVRLTQKILKKYKTVTK